MLELRRLLGEDVEVGAKEADELVFLFGRKVGPDDRHFGGIVGLQANGLGWDLTARLDPG